MPDKRTIFAFVLLLLSLPCFGQTQASSKSNSQKNAENEGRTMLLAHIAPEGKKLFVQYCAMCHTPNKDAVGPKLRKVTRKRKEAWLIKMITNGDALQKSGDKTANRLFKKYDRIQHPNFENLSQTDIAALLKYLKTL